MATSADTRPTVAQLRAIDLFAELADDEVGAWADAASLREAAAGERITEYGDPHSGVILLLDGRLEMLAPDGDVEARQGTQDAPTWVGAIPALLGAPRMVTLRAGTAIRYAEVSAERFIDLTLAHRSVFTRVMAQMKPVLGRMSQRRDQQDRLEALGTMAAGLAHELNNPASAARQAARDLADALGVLSQTIGVFVESGVEREQAARLVALQATAVERCAQAPTLSALEAADREDELTDALTELGLDAPWTLSATLTAGGLDPAFVREVGDTAGPLAAPVVRWITATLSARQLAAELSDSTERMSDLVRAIKRYAYAAPGEVQQVDLHDQLDTTVTLLKHKLKHTSITVTRHYDDALPHVAAHGSELNQVWTNLLDNAIDALGDSGEITLTTRVDGSCVEVDVADDGPGIAPDVRRRVFDPFFTTKEVGRGTGLGLDTARRIIVDRHHGSLTVDSRTASPSGTVFRVRLPVDGPRDERGRARG